jgi:hypothetical protein
MEENAHHSLRASQFRSKIRLKMNMCLTQMRLTQQLGIMRSLISIGPSNGNLKGQLMLSTDATGSFGRVDGVEENGRLKFHLQLSRAAFLKIKDNPRGVPLGPTPEQMQAFVEKKERKAREDEHWWQRGIEQALKRELESRHRIQQMKEQ